jgi:hypothetical protein
LAAERIMFVLAIAMPIIGTVLAVGFVFRGKLALADMWKVAVATIPSSILFVVIGLLLRWFRLPKQRRFDEYKKALQTDRLKRDRVRDRSKKPDLPELVVNSGLTDEEIGEMAERLRIRFPELHRILSHPQAMESLDEADGSLNLFERASIGAFKYVRECETISCSGGRSYASKVQQHLVYYIAGWKYRIISQD